MNVVHALNTRRFFKSNLEMSILLLKENEICIVKQKIFYVGIVIKKYNKCVPGDYRNFRASPNYHVWEGLV